MTRIEVDFTDVDTQSGFLAPGMYNARVASVEHKEGRNFPGLKLAFQSTETETEGMRSEMFISLSPKALWKLKITLESLGVEVPQSVMKLETQDIVGKVGKIEVTNEPWTDAAGDTHDSSKVDKVLKSVAGAEPDDYNREPDVSEDDDSDLPPF